MNVLVLTDFSETSANAGKYAVDFLQEEEVNFHLLNIHSFNFDTTASKNLQEELIITLQALESSIATLRNYSANKRHKFDLILSSENLISVIRKTLHEKKIDLIIIGAVSHNNHAHPILGDHAYEVVRKIKCNIIAIPGGCTFERPEKAVFPVDPAVLPVHEQNNILERLEFLRSSSFTMLEIKDGDINYPHQKNIPFKTPVPFTRDLFREIQRQFQIIFVVGKNLSICDRLLHAKYGFSAEMEVEIPIFVYHG